MGEKYSLVVSVMDSKGNEDFTDTKSYGVNSSSKVEIGSVDVSKLPTDKYDFTISLKKESGDLLTQTLKTFYIFNPKVKDLGKEIVGENDFMLSEFAKYPENVLQSDYEKMIYILTHAQKLQYEKLTDIDAKRLFMYNFWRTYIPGNPDPSKAHNSYLTRISFANLNYREDFREGWKTDRGRIYAIYGPYDDIDRHAYESETRAYEIWTYNNIQGGVYFVFVDLSAGAGNWTLVHSTALNEINDDTWKSRLDFHR
jgi:GWxTD domain-containing protein